MTDTTALQEPNLDFLDFGQQSIDPLNWFFFNQPIDEILLFASQELLANQLVSAWPQMGTASAYIQIGGTLTSLEWQETPRIWADLSKVASLPFEVVQSSQIGDWITATVNIPSGDETSEPRPTTLPESLLRKQKHAIRLAKKYHKEHGNPVDDLVDVLSQIVTDEESWREILDEPYG